MASDQTIIKKLTEALKSHLVDWYGEGSQLISEFPERSDRTFTVFLYYHVITGDHREIKLILKLPHDHWMRSLQEILDSEHIRSFARQEAEILQRMEAATQNSGNSSLGAIHILAYLPEFCAVVMENLDFTTFKRKYLDMPQFLMGSTTMQAADHDAFLAGTWLKLYHETFSQDQQIPTSQLPILDTIHERLQKIEEYSGSSLTEIRTRFENAHTAIRDVPHPISRLHNDFHFNNVILAQDGKVGAFDPNPEPPGSIYLDVARILTDCTIRKKQVFSRGLFFGKAFIQQIKSSIFKGYQTPLNKQVLDFYCAATVLEKWADDEESIQNSKLKYIFPLMFRGYYKKKIIYYLT